MRIDLGEVVVQVDLAVESVIVDGNYADLKMM